MGYFFLKVFDLYKVKDIIPQVIITAKSPCLHFHLCQRLKDLLPAVKCQFPTAHKLIIRGRELKPINVNTSLSNFTTSCCSLDHLIHDCIQIKTYVFQMNFEYSYNKSDYCTGTDNWTIWFLSRSFRPLTLPLAFIIAEST